MSSSNNFKLQGFETEIFGAPVWQLLNVSAANEVVDLAKSNNVQLISYRDETNLFDFKKRRFLETARFYEIETLVTLEKEIEKCISLPEFIHQAVPDDAEICAQIAAVCFKNDRYHTDKNITNDIADTIKSRWVYNSVIGRADKVFIYKDQSNNVLGFNACMYHEDTAVIDLIGVHPDHQGKGIGRSLLKAMEQYYSDKAGVIRLGTQLSNERSIKFYMEMNFAEKSRKTTWHWFNIGSS